MYTDYTRNENFHILIIRGRKIPYSDNTRNARKFKYLIDFEAKAENTLDGYSGAQMGSFGQTSLL